jgi:uncharacterized iron-regulated membrane protein
MTLRRVVFWVHLLTGLVAGTIVLGMAATGALLAFEPQLAAFSERDRRTVTPPAPAAMPQTLDALLVGVRTALPEAAPTRLLVRAEPTASVVVSLGQEDAVFVDPYTGRILGPLSGLHQAMHTVVEWHRWLGSRELGRPITGACNLAFLGLAISGLYLWWPRGWSRQALRAVSVPDVGLRGRARDFNWHNAIGLWGAPVLIVLTLTGAVISYQWASDLLYRLAGSEPPPAPAAARGGGGRPDARAGGGGRERKAAALGPGVLEAVRQHAAREVPGWVSLTVRLPARPGAPVSAFIEETSAWHPSPRSQLTLDAATAAVVRWEPFAQADRGRRLRAWVRPLHTGEAFGVVGQAVAGLASAGAVVLVWTGLALAWRRYRAWSARTRPSGARSDACEIIST